jgi:hypothetical protein
MCASTFCRSGDSTTATVNLQIDASIQQQLAAYVKSAAPALRLLNRTAAAAKAASEVMQAVLVASSIYVRCSAAAMACVTC